MPREDADILVITADGVGKRTPFAEYRLTHRGARGVLTMARDGKGGTLVGALSVAEGDHVMLITEGGIITRMAVDEIRVIGRTTQGVIIQRVPEGDQIAAVALVPEADEAEADAAAAAVTSLDEALAEPADSEGGPFDAPGVVPPEDVAVVAGVGESPEEVEAATDEMEAGSAPEPEDDPDDTLEVDPDELERGSHCLASRPGKGAAMTAYGRREEWRTRPRGGRSSLPTPSCAPMSTGADGAEKRRSRCTSVRARASPGSADARAPRGSGPPHPPGRPGRP